MSALVWFRNDLRVNDNQLLFEALKNNKKVYFFYCFDKRQFTKTSYGFPKTGKFRANFLIETVIDLKENLEKLGVNLIIKFGFPEEEIKYLVEKYDIKEIYFQGAVTQEEIDTEKLIEKNTLDKNITLKKYFSNTLYNINDLPFDLEQMPDIFTNFRQKIERFSKINEIYQTPEKIEKVEIDSNDLALENIPNIKSLIREAADQEIKVSTVFRGGQTEALKRLDYYLWQSDLIANYKETRNGLLGDDYATKFSPWLANGSLSARTIYHEIQKYEKKRTKNQSTYWIIFELLWRDFFWFTAAKYKNKIFQIRGTNTKAEKIELSEDINKFNLWKNGKTGIPFIDANMLELKKTGFMSNRGRQNVASFLTKDLKINWIIGAEYFESLLIDYDVASNWGNWNYVAGVGADPRSNRYFNIIKQSRVYDPQGEYIKHWLPQLKNLPAKLIYQPYKLSLEEQENYKIKLGIDYPQPIIELEYKD